MDYAQTLEWLFSQLPMYQRVGSAAYKADLSNTHKLMELLGHPEKKFKSIHVAGTNGKGSVCHMLAAIFQKAGYKTGLYTSPHLKDFRERIKINGEMISEERVVQFVENHKNSFTESGLSFFEMTVGMAFDHFVNEDVDIAILETGMGGRLDSTNVVTPELSIITNISLDHTSFLGSDIKSIAQEKGGIIKKGVPVLIGERQEVSELVFKKIALEKEASIYFSSEILPPGQTDVGTDLKGLYQVKNMQTALAATVLLEKMGYKLAEHRAAALKMVIKLTGLRGRWEVLGENPKIIADTAHNTAGIQEVLEQIRKQSYRKLHIVWGMVNDKDLKNILMLLPKGAIYYFCKPNIPRGKDAEQLKLEGVRYGLSGKAYPNVKTAYKAARENALNYDLIFVGGSTFVVAEVL